MADRPLPFHVQVQSSAAVMSRVLDLRGALRRPAGAHDEDSDSDDSLVLDRDGDGKQAVRHRRGSRRARNSSALKGPMRLARVVLVSVLPAILVGWPLYMRYHVLRDHAFSLAPSDVRVLNQRVSTTWCQAQTVRVNSTFSAFVLDSKPGLGAATSRQRTTLVRDLVLGDDMKEYWGFYLLQGSAVTVSTCARWPGASLIVIRGHQHLQECAYIGDNSSEEDAELRRYALRRQLEERRRSRQHAGRQLTEQGGQLTEQGGQLTEQGGQLTEQGGQLTEQGGQLTEQGGQQTEQGGQLTEQSSQRTEQGGQLTEQEGQVTETGSTQQTGRASTRNPSNQPKRMRKVKDDAVEFHEKQLPPSRLYYLLDDSAEDVIVDVNASNALHIFTHGRAAWAARHPPPPGSNGSPPARPPGQPSESDEILDDLARRLRALGDKGGRALHKLSVILGSAGRTRRDIIGDLNVHDEARNSAREVDQTEAHLGAHLGAHPDTRGTVTEPASLDESRSELWSSFSSSEEALLGCAGLVLNLPLSPHRSCRADLDPGQLGVAAAANKITYRVPVDGYYFFVLNSENEVQQNFVRVGFDLDRAVYDISHPVASCSNATGSCSLPLRFLSDDTVVLEVGVVADPNGDHFLGVTACEPRTALYLSCVVAVPLLILLCAFH